MNFYIFKNKQYKTIIWKVCLNRTDSIKNYYNLFIQAKFGNACKIQNSSKSFPCNSDYDYNTESNQISDFGIGCYTPYNYIKGKIFRQLLDLGSGTGTDCFLYSRISDNVTGIDLSSEMISLARIFSEKLKINNLKFIEGDFHTFDFDKQKFDIICANAFLSLNDNPEYLFNKIINLLEDSGILIISDIFKDFESVSYIKSNNALISLGLDSVLSEKYLVNLLKSKFNSNLKVYKKEKLKIPYNLMMKHLKEDGIIDFYNKYDSYYQMVISIEKNVK